MINELASRDPTLPNSISGALRSRGAAVDEVEDVDVGDVGAVVDAVVGVDVGVDVGVAVGKDAGGGDR